MGNFKIECMVSVCMITYNHEPFIRQAIEGVLMQKTNFPYVLVIGEDCSTDNTRIVCEEYIKKYPHQINLLPSDQNLGIMANFIRTLEACKGKYIALCEGDDYWTDPLKLQKQVNFLEGNKEYSMCFHPVKILQNGELIDDYITRVVDETTDIDELAKGNYMHTASVFFRKFWNKLPDWLNKCSIGDYPLHMINAQNGNIKKLSDIMAVYRIHGANIWVNQNQEEMAIKIHNYLGEMIGNFPEAINNLLISRFISESLNLMNKYYAEGDYEEAGSYYRKVIEKSPKSILDDYFQKSASNTARFHIKELNKIFINKIKSLFRIK